MFGLWAAPSQPKCQCTLCSGSLLTGNRLIAQTLTGCCCPYRAGYKDPVLRERPPNRLVGALGDLAVNSLSQFGHGAPLPLSRPQKSLYIWYLEATGCSSEQLGVKKKSGDFRKFETPGAKIRFFVFLGLSRHSASFGHRAPAESVSQTPFLGSSAGMRGGDVHHISCNFSLISTFSGNKVD